MDQVQTTDELRPFVQSFEQCRLKAYRCPAGVWTAGWGHTSSAGAPLVTSATLLTQEQADAALDADLAHVTAQVLRLVAKAATPVEPHELDALTSLVFNIGSGNFAGSTVLRKLLRGDKAGAADAFLAWNKARVDGQLVVVRGLVRRRAAERTLFLSGHDAVDVASVDFGDMPQAVEEPELREPLHRSVTANAAGGTVVGGGLIALDAGKQAVAFLGDAKDQARQAAGVFGIPDDQAILGGAGVLIVVAGLVVIWRRYRRSVEDIVVEVCDGIHIPIVGDILGRTEKTVTKTVTAVEAKVETDEGVVTAAVQQVETKVDDVEVEATPAVEAAVSDAQAAVADVRTAVEAAVADAPLVAEVATHGTAEVEAALKTLATDAKAVAAPVVAAAQALPRVPTLRAT